MLIFSKWLSRTNVIAKIDVAQMRTLRAIYLRKLYESMNDILVEHRIPVLRLHSIPSMGPSKPIDGHRNFFRWASMGFELSPSAWGQLWSIFGLNISNFNLLSFPFEPEQAFSSLKITYIGALSLNCLKKLKNLAKLQLFA